MPQPQMQAKACWTHRPEFDPAPDLVAPGGGQIVSPALAEGATLDQAHDTLTGAPCLRFRSGAP